jgi:hypothetical protein
MASIRVRRIPLARVIAAIGTLLMFHFGWHQLFQMGWGWTDALNRWHCVKHVNGNAAILEVVVPGLLLGAFISDGSRLYSPLGERLSLALWPLLILPLDAIHLAYDHQGLIYWWPTSAAQTASYVMRHYANAGVSIFIASAIRYARGEGRRRRLLAKLGGQGSSNGD